MKASKLYLHGIFVGYDNASNAYKIYNLQTKKIMITKDVVFNEMTHGAPILKEKG
jgi:hypothetical protein